VKIVNHHSVEIDAVTICCRTAKQHLTYAAVERASESCNGNPLVVVRTDARYADGRVGGMGSENVCKRNPHGLRPRWFYSKLHINKTKRNRSENIFSWKIYFTYKGQIRFLRVCVIGA